ncbi:MAG TPA: hypothetical protein VKR56_10425 [Candidatus Cybelea sp.]|nr:hypothetical protein [Candidatus Cybelea sp.]
MKSFNRYALNGGVAIALLAGCGASQPPGGTPPAMPQTARPIRSEVTLAAKSNGYLFVDDYAYNRIEIVTNGSRASSFEGQLQAPGWKTIGTIKAGLSNQPANNWVDKQGNLYVPGYNFTANGPTQPQVTEYNPSGALKFVYSSNMEFPGGVTTDAKGNVFEADRFDGLNEYHQGSNALVATCPRTGGDQGVAVDAQGDVFTGYGSSDGTGTIIEYHGGLAGCSYTALGVSLGQPDGLALDKSANLLVCDFTNQTVDVIAPPYSQVSSHLGGDRGPISLRYMEPVDVSLNKDNSLAYVTDWFAQKVDVLTYPAGEAFAEVGSGDGISYPIAAVDSSNYVP